MTDTVKIRVIIRIASDNECDTGLTVEEWNALTDAERSEIAHENWEAEAANGDSGGMAVTTGGAKDV